jgi:hypothetical protein
MFRTHPDINTVRLTFSHQLSFKWEVCTPPHFNLQHYHTTSQLGTFIEYPAKRIRRKEPSPMSKICIPSLLSLHVGIQQNNKAAVFSLEPTHRHTTK